MSLCVCSSLAIPVFSHLLLPQREERTMLEDIQATLSELDKVAFYFKQLDECFVASESIHHFHLLCDYVFL